VLIFPFMVYNCSVFIVMEKKDKVLFLAPPYMDIYKDVISCLESMNFDVTWVEDAQVKCNPYNKHDINRNTKSVEEYDKEVNEIWRRLFHDYEKDDCFKYFFAIDGLMVSEFFFEELRKRNPEIKTLLYLYDRVEGNFELDVFFKYYDRIYTFDRSDSLLFKINLLPIFWVPRSNTNIEIYDIFGMGSYNSKQRYRIFSNIKNLAIKEGLRENVHLWHPLVNNKVLYFIKYLIKKMMGKNPLSLSQLHDDLITHQTLTPDEFRESICQSKVILDTNLPYQDGLTARFMWALGAEKKIITTNKSAVEYPFYSDEQVFIIQENLDGIVDFIKKTFKMPDDIRERVVKFRIDNWIKEIFNL